MDFKNVFNLIRCFVIGGYKKELLYLFVLAVVGAILLNFDLLVLIYSLLSILFAARIFRNLQKPQSAIFYMMLPASTAEKTMANFLLVSVIYPLTCFLLALLSLGMHLLWCKLIHNTSSMFPHDTNVSLGFFLLLAIFSFASVYYKKHSFRNVCFWAVALLFFVLIYTGIFCCIFSTNNILFVDFLVWKEPMNDLFGSYPIVYRVIQLLLICFFWGMTYLRLKETEV